MSKPRRPTGSDDSKPRPPAGPDDVTPDPPTPAIRVLAILATGAAAYAMSSILVPFLLALVLAIALTPVAFWIERRGAGRTIASLLCMLMVAGFLLGTASLIAYQANGILRDGDKYVDRIGDLAARSVRFIGGDAALRSLISDSNPEVAADADAAEVEGRPTAAPSTEETPRADEGDKMVARAREALRADAASLGGYAMTGVGGALGLLAGAVLMLAFLFYMLQGRSEWIHRFRKAAQGLGMRPLDKELPRVAHELKTYIGTLAAVSVAYAVIITGVLWMIGVPQPMLWGALTALLELVPFFGPFIAGALPTLAALGGGEGIWQPIAVIVTFGVLQTIEGYVVAPLLYGNAVEIDPVTVLLGVLFFGFLLGPAGLTLAMPLMILLRGVLAITPDTPALDALADAEAPGKTKV